MGSFRLKVLVAVAAIVVFAGAVLVVARGDGSGEIVAAPTTVDGQPESLALDLADDDDPEISIGDDATWMPTTSVDDATDLTEQVEEVADEADEADESSTTSGSPSASTPTSAVSGNTNPTTATSGGSDSSPTSSSDTGTPNTAAPSSTPTTSGNSPTTAPTTATTSAPTTTSTTERRPTVGFSGIDVEDFTNSNVNISQNGQDGSFRTVCTVSHFNFDDAIVFPGQQAATHLHMYFGNTLADFSSTGASLASSGDASCQGGPLNRSAYWVPAVLDQNGDVRPAQYMLAYYKRAGDEDVVPYPNGLQMVAGNAMAMSPQPGREQPIGGGIDYKWSCGSPITVGIHDSGRLIPDCAPGEFLTLSLIFPRCGDGRLESADNKSHMAYPARYGGACPASHPIRHPQLTYNIHWNNNDTNTGGWYLSSDDHQGMGGMLMPGGTTTHADWIGAWHPEVLDIMTTGCFNADHDCKGGTISPSLRLDSPNVQGYSPSNIYDSTVSPVILPPLA